MASLGDREAGPHPHRPAYPSLAAYLLAFAIWRAIHHDAQLTTDEWGAKLEVQLDQISRMAYDEKSARWQRVPQRRDAQVERPARQHEV